MAEVLGSVALACMGKLDQPAALSQLLLSGGGVQVRPEHAEPFLKPNRGSVILSKYDNGGQLMTGLKETGGCKLFSKEAARQDVELMIIERFRPTVRARLLRMENDKGLVRRTFAVTLRGKRLFLQIFGPQSDSAGGAFVEVWPPQERPPAISPTIAIEWPD